MENMFQKMDVLMKTILETRFSDLEKDYTCCLELLSLGDNMNSTYAKAFAYTYLGDYYLATTDTKKSIESLFKAKQLCSRVSYPELYMKICHLMGFHYNLVLDEQSALENYIESIQIAEELGDIYQQCNAWNNIASMYDNRGAIDESMQYYLKAYHALNKQENFDTRLMIIILYNLTLLSAKLNDYDKLLEHINTMERLVHADRKQSQEETSFQHLCLHCVRFLNEAYLQHNDMALKNAQELLDLHFYDVKEKYIVLMFILPIIESLISLHLKDCAFSYLSLLEEYYLNNEVSILENLNNLQIQYAEAFLSEEQINESYKQYYKMLKRTKRAEDEVRVEGMNAKVHLHDIIHRQADILKENQRLVGEAINDDLTGLYNRRHFNNQVKKVQDDNQIKSIGIIMLDVDYFKQYNDNYGHFHGDLILREVADTLKNRDNDRIIPFRYGGDEFICICVNCSNKDVEAYIQDVREHITSLKLKHEYSACSSFITLSIGYSNHPKNHSFDMDELLNQADDALYHAKALGRDCWQRY